MSGIVLEGGTFTAVRGWRTSGTRVQHLEHGVLRVFSWIFPVSDSHNVLLYS